MTYLLRFQQKLSIKGFIWFVVRKYVFWARDGGVVEGFTSICSKMCESDSMVEQENVSECMAWTIDLWGGAEC